MTFYQLWMISPVWTCFYPSSNIKHCSSHFEAFSNRFRIYEAMLIQFLELQSGGGKEEVEENAGERRERMVYTHRICGATKSGNITVISRNTCKCLSLLLIWPVLHLMQLKLDNLRIYLNLCVFMFLSVLYDLNLIWCLMYPFVSWKLLNLLFFSPHPLCGMDYLNM